VAREGRRKADKDGNGGGEIEGTRDKDRSGENIAVE